MKTENERFGLSSSTLPFSPIPFPLPPPPGNPTWIRAGVRSVTLIAGAEACSPGPSQTLRAAAFTDRTRAACQPLRSVTALQDLYAVDGIETSLWTPKFINNEGEKKLGVW